MTDGKPFKRYTDDIPPLGTEHHRLSPDSKDRDASATLVAKSYRSFKSVEIFMSKESGS